jgi:hypothetical protein
MAEIGFVSCASSRTFAAPWASPIECDEHCEAKKTLSAYAEDARAHPRIVTGR